jgi:large subunit ribosomal protein L10
VPTQEKIESVRALKARLDGVKAVLITEYRGLTVQQLSDLRKQLRAVSAEYKVVKNRLAKLALTPPLEGVKGLLKGPTAMIISKQDPVAVAKALHAFARTNQALVIKAGYVEGQMLEPAGLKALADLPSRETLRAQIVGAIQGPLAQLVGLLKAPHREIAYVLAQRGSASGAGASGDASGEMTESRASGAGASGDASGEMTESRASGAGASGEASGGAGASGEASGETSEKSEVK